MTLTKVPLGLAVLASLFLLGRTQSKASDPEPSSRPAPGLCPCTRPAPPKAAPKNGTGKGGPDRTPTCKDDDRTCGAIAKAESEERARWMEAMAAEQDHDWEAAAKAYLKVATETTDPQKRDEARKRFESARAHQRGWLWRLGTLAPPLLWWETDPDVLKWALLVLLGLGISPKVLRGTGAVGRLAQGARVLLMPRFRGRAFVVTPIKMTDGTQAELFGAQLPLSVLEVRARWKRAGLSLQSGTTPLLSVPSALAQQITDNLPADVYGKNLGKITAAVALLASYFGWRVETRLAYCPAPASGALPTVPAPTAPGRMKAYATLRWAWFAKRSFRVTPRASDAHDVDKAAFGIAARLMGEGLR
jgi:hypothetical protein